MINGNGGGANSGGKPKPADIPGILREPGVAAPKLSTDIPKILPHERVFPIQIGSELFRLSGASISSDGMWPFPCGLGETNDGKDGNGAC